MYSFFMSILNWLYAVFHIKRGTEKPGKDPIIDGPIDPDDPEIICYYGCPNSKKARKLQLSKKIYK